MNSLALKNYLYGLLLIFLVACGQTKKEDSTEVAKEENKENIEDKDLEKDADFVVNTVAGNYAEIKMAQLAQNKSSDPKVKEMATKLESDHTKILNELKAYANKKGIAVPMEENTDAEKDLNSLAESNAGDFDKKWCEALEDKHEKTINKFESRLDKTEDPELKDWISATLPGLKSHLEMLKEHDESAK
jgi:putative membrane protein